MPLHITHLPNNRIRARSIKRPHINPPASDWCAPVPSAPTRPNHNTRNATPLPNWPLCLLAMCEALAYEVHDEIRYECDFPEIVRGLYEHYMYMGSRVEHVHLGMFGDCCSDENIIRRAIKLIQAADARTLGRTVDFTKDAASPNTNNTDLLAQPEYSRPGKTVKRAPRNLRPHMVRPNTTFHAHHVARHFATPEGVSIYAYSVKHAPVRNVTTYTLHVEPQRAHTSRNKTTHTFFRYAANMIQQQGPHTDQLDETAARYLINEFHDYNPDDFAPSTPNSVECAPLTPSTRTLNTSSTVPLATIPHIPHF